MNIKGGRLHQCIKCVGVAVPFWNKQRINLAAQVSAVTDVGQFAADHDGKAEVPMLDDRGLLPLLLLSGLHLQAC
ncbi:hypothetical protein D3C81_1793600 [compost metagenome]